MGDVIFSGEKYGAYHFPKPSFYGNSSTSDIHSTCLRTLQQIDQISYGCQPVKKYQVTEKVALGTVVLLQIDLPLLQMLV